MQSRGKKILQLVTSECQHLLDVPRYESTKGSISEERKKYLTYLREKDQTKGNETTTLATENFESNDGSTGKRVCIDQVTTNELINAKTLSNTNMNEHDDIEIEKKRSEEKLFQTLLPVDVESQKIESEGVFQSSGSEYVPDSTDTESLKSVEHEYVGKIALKPALNNDECGTDSTLSSKQISESFILKSSQKNATKSNVDGAIVSFGKFVTASSSTVEQFGNVRPWTKKNFCPYCFRDVTHFPRHLARNHPNEVAVKEYFSLSKKDPKRKQLLNVIRRQGNFMSTSRNKVIRPIRRPKSNQLFDENKNNAEDTKEKYIVCKDCLGYFSRNYLRRHRKQCASRKIPSILNQREQHLTAAQLFSVCSGSHNDFLTSLRLTNEVLPIMRNDNISKTAMNDKLICCFAEDLLKKHKRTQIRNVISNKMRELSRLLIALREITGLECLFDVLKPELLDNCVAATKIITGYNNETRTFKASSLALHMGTTLKQVSDVAIKMIITKSHLFPCSNPEDKLKDVKNFRELIKNHWNTEISSLALKNLNEQRFQNPKLLPLTEDVMLFQNYLLDESKKAYTALSENKHIKISHRRLSECVLAMTLLLNRKRIGEIQYLKMSTYTKTPAQNLQEELFTTLSEIEKTLTTSFRRVVTEGKGNRPVAILFPKDVQKFIDMLLKTRNMCVPDGNEYLFANPNTKNGWLSGYHTLKKLAGESNVSDTTFFTSTRLRKQIATVLQVLNMTENEMEQFAQFMGHTKKTHESYYRLPQDVYQTAKVSKILLAINSGKVALYKGKTLNEIGVSDLENDESEDEESKIYQNPHCLAEDRGKHNEDLMISENASEESLQHSGYNDKKTKKVFRRDKRMKWTTEQKILIQKHFKNNIKEKRAPRKQEVEFFLKQHQQMFEESNWVKLKAFVYNCYKSRK